MMHLFDAIHSLLGGAKGQEVKDLENFRKKFGLTTRGVLYIDSLYRTGYRKNTALAQKYQTYLKPGFQIPKSLRLQSKATDLMKKLEESASKSYKSQDKYREDQDKSEMVFGKDAAVIEDKLYDGWAAIRRIPIKINNRSELKQVLDQIQFVKQNKDEYCLCYALNNILMLSKDSKTIAPVRLSTFFSVCLRIGEGCRSNGYFNTRIAEIILKDLGYRTIYTSIKDRSELDQSYILFSIGVICIINPENPHFVAVIRLGLVWEDDNSDLNQYFLYLDSLVGAEVYKRDKLVDKLEKEGCMGTLTIYDA